MTRERLTLLAIILLSFALLSVRLGERSLWVDELGTWQMTRGAGQDVLESAMRDLHPPLYFLGVSAWTALAGAGDFSLRWFSVAAGIVAVALMPSVARRLIGPRAAVPAALVLALAPAFIEFSRMARYYAMILAIGLLSTRLLLDALDRPSAKRWWAYGLSGATLLYTFYPSGILLIAHGLFVWRPAVSRRTLARWLATLAAVGLVFVPWLAVAAGAQLAHVTSSQGADLARSSLGFSLGVAASFYTYSVGETVFPWSPVAWVGIAVMAILVVRGLRSAPDRRAGRVLGVFLACTVFMSIVTTFVSVDTPFLNVPVRGLFALSFLVLGATAGIVGLGSRRSRILLTAALVGVWSIATLNYFAGRQYLNPIYLTPAREAAAYVRHNAQPGDLMLSDPDSVFSRYFLPTADGSTHLHTDQVDEFETVLRATRPQHVWLVTIGRDRTQRSSTSGAIRALLADDYARIDAVPMLPIDPVYKSVKDFLLQRESYAYRLTIELYLRVAQ